MNNDFLDPINAQGMPDMADATFALDLLMATKNGVRNCAVALTESITPEARRVIRTQLEQGVRFHQEVSQLMLSKGWLHPYNVSEQFQLDIMSADTALKIAQMKLYPDHTSRLGMFDMPPKQKQEVTVQ